MFQNFSGLCLCCVPSKGYHLFDNYYVFGSLILLILLIGMMYCYMDLTALCFFMCLYQYLINLLLNVQSDCEGHALMILITSQVLVSARREFWI